MRKKRPTPPPATATATATDPRAEALSQQLIEAIASRDPELAEDALRLGAQAGKAHGATGATPLGFLLKQPNPNLEIARLLLQAGAEPTPHQLFQAASRDESDVFIALARHAPASTRFDLIEATQTGLAHLLCVGDDMAPALAWALRRGADANLLNRHGKCPVVLACEHGAIECLRVLIDHGADLNSRDGVGNTPLILALAAHNEASRECTKLLIQQPQCDVSAMNQSGASAAMWAASRSLEILSMVAARGGNLRARTPGGLTPGLIAARGGKLDCLQFLSAQGALSLTDADRFGRDCAMHAAAWGHLESLVFLAHQGADLRARDPDGDTCLERAQEAAHHDCVEFIHAWRERAALAVEAGAKRPAARL